MNVVRNIQPLSPITVCLVGCGKAKLPRAAKAADLYTGSLFQASRRYAESCDEWRILSARYGLLHPDTVVTPYDQRVKPKERAQWGAVVANRLIGEMLDCGPYDVVILAGEDYAQPMIDALRSESAWRCNCIGARSPMRGLGIGERMQWLMREWRIDAPLVTRTVTKTVGGE